MKDPAVLFYTSDFLTGTAFFTDAQRGQYIRLLCEQHQIGHIPENHMVSVCLSLGSPVVKKFVQDENGLYYNERMEEEITKRREFADSRRVNGLKGGRPKSNKKPSGKPSGKPYAKATHNLPENGNENENRILLGGMGEEFSSDETPEKKVLTWRDDFEVYKSDLMKVYEELLKDAEFIKDREKYHSNLDISLTLEKAVKDFWGTVEGWKHKKKKKCADINWKSTLSKAIDLPSNQVKKPYGSYNKTTSAVNSSIEARKQQEEYGTFKPGDKAGSRIISITGSIPEAQTAN